MAVCRLRGLIVRKTMVVIVNIVLIFIGGYGIAKGVVRGAEGAAEVASLAARVGTVRAVAQTAGRVAKGVGKLVLIEGRNVWQFLRALSRPVETLAKIQKSLNLVLLAVEDEGVWNALRGRTGTIVESERQFWQERRKFWKNRANRLHERHPPRGFHQPDPESLVASRSSTGPPNATQTSWTVSYRRSAASRSRSSITSSGA